MVHWFSYIDGGEPEHLCIYAYTLSIPVVHNLCTN